MLKTTLRLSYITGMLLYILVLQLFLQYIKNNGLSISISVRLSLELSIALQLLVEAVKFYSEQNQIAHDPKNVHEARKKVVKYPYNTATIFNIVNIDNP